MTFKTIALGGRNAQGNAHRAYPDWEEGVKPNQIALTWLLHYAPNIILIPGTTTIAHLEENMAAAEIELTQEQIKTLNQFTV